MMYYLFCCCSVAQSCPTLWNPMDWHTPGFPVLHYLMEFAQTHVHWVSDAIQPSHPLSPSSPPPLNLSQHQGLFQWVGSSYQSIGASVSATVLPMSIQGWFPLGNSFDILLKSIWYNIGNFWIYEDIYLLVFFSSFLIKFCIEISHWWCKMMVGSLPRYDRLSFYKRSIAIRTLHSEKKLETGRIVTKTYLLILRPSEDSRWTFPPRQHQGLV